MTTLLIKNIHTLVSMDDQRRELKDSSLYIKDYFIQAVGSTDELPAIPFLSPEQIPVLL